MSANGVNGSPPVNGTGVDMPDPDPERSAITTEITRVLPSVDIEQIPPDLLERLEAYGARLVAPPAASPRAILTEALKVLDELGKRPAGRADAGRALQAIVAKAKGPSKPPGFDLIGPDVIFAPLPPARWVCGELEIGPGRPCIFGGYGYSAKSLAAQSCGLSVATGRPIWGYFRPDRKGRVIHLDHEQGYRATNLRYQRLAIGLGINRADVGDRLAVSIFPRVQLTDPEAEDVFARETEGADLCIIDALRGATPDIDENDSRIRAYIDILSRVSERTGVTFLILHHAGKPSQNGGGNDEDAELRTVLRGSSAIFDAANSVYVLIAQKGEDAGKKPKRVVQAKSAADGFGATVEPFYLAIEDVPMGHDQKAGVRVLHRTTEQIKPPPAAAPSFDQLTERVLLEIKRAPGIKHTELAVKVGGRDTLVKAARERLAREGRIECKDGPKGAVLSYPKDSWSNGSGGAT